MTMQALTFSPSQATAPTGSLVPTAQELRGMSLIAADLRRSGRATLMNQICRALNMPPGGWSIGQSHLFENGDIRLVALLALFAKEHMAQRIANNLHRAGQFTDVNIMLALVTAAREHSGALTATGERMIDSFHEGGLDFLWDEKDHLGLPRSVTGVWEEIRRFRNPESNHLVHPARIPAGDQMVVYAAQIATSFRSNFKNALTAALGKEADSALARTSRIGVLIWQAYAFLAPGGAVFDPGKAIGMQVGQHFGIRSALGYVAYLARSAKGDSELDRVYSDPALNRSAWVRSAKTRAAETLFLECLLKQARIILSP